MSKFFTTLQELLDAALDVLVNLVVSLINIFPDGALPAEVSTSFQTVANYMYMFDILVPIDTLFTILSLAFFFELMLFVVRLTKWFIGRVTDVV